MQILYLDNFRGFSKTFLEIKNINFFVGENSTGKTSVLSLIYLLSKYDFWYNQDFNISNINLGYFEDIISKFSENKDYFIIGYCKFNKNSKENKCILLKFICKDSLPRINEFCIMCSDLNIHVIVKNKSFKYSIERINIGKSDDINKFFANWVNNFYNIKEDEKFRNIFVKKKLDYDIIFHIQRLIKKDLSEINSGFSEKFTLADPELFERIIWIAPIRSKPKIIYEGLKVYFSPEGEHVPFLLKRIMEDKKKSQARLKITKYIDDFGIESGLFESISIKKYGKGRTSPFGINIILDKLPFKISNVGYGVSQILPILADSVATPRRQWIAIQQPEVHLHPKAQASIGDLIYNVAFFDEKNFLIETHSDYLIDRFRLNQFKKGGNMSSQVIFFERENNFNKVYQIDINKDGKYSENQPRSFRDFFIKEQISILEL